MGFALITVGGKFPVERVHPGIVKQFKKECFLETAKLVDKYRRICNRKKVAHVKYSI